MTVEIKMATKKTNKTMENKIETNMESKVQAKCNDPKCPFHGQLRARGRIFRGAVIRKFPKRIAIEFERTLYIKKDERYAKAKTRLHARLPDCLANSINIGDYVEIMECRPISKIIKFVVMKKIR